MSLAFIPAFLGQFDLAANFAINDTHGDFGGAVELSGPREVPFFVARSGNGRLNWSHRRFGAHVGLHYVGEYARAVSLVLRGASLYTHPRTVYAAGVSYQIRPNFRLTADIENLFGEPQQSYRGNPDQLALAYLSGVSLVFGVSGRF